MTFPLRCALLAAFITLTLPNEALSSTLDEAAHLLARVTGSEPRPYSTRDFGREPYPDARSVLVEEHHARAQLNEIRQHLGPRYVAFIGTRRSLADQRAQSVEIVIAPGTSQFDIIYVAASDAVNYGMETDDLVSVLRRWDQSIGIEIFAAQTDRISFRLKSPPANLNAFAKEVYEFCPDIVDQESATLADLATEIATTNEVHLWWD